MIQKDTDLRTVAARLADTYAVQSRGSHIIHNLRLTHVTAESVERLRCEPDIELLSYDVPVYDP